MKVLALNSSPRGEGQSKTGLMLNPLVLGMRDAGAEVEVVDLRKKTIRNCSGLFYLLDQDTRSVYSQGRYDRGALPEIH